MKPTRVALTALSLVFAIAPAARAASIGFGTYVHGAINNADCRTYSSSLGNPSCMFSGTDPRFWWPGGVSYVSTASAAAFLFDADESIAASASLATGDLSVSLSDTGNSPFTSVSAFMWDTLTFHFADSNWHQVSVTMTGAASTSGGATAAYKLDVGQYGDPNSTQNALNLNGFIPLTTGPYSVSASTLVQDGTSVSFIAMLWLLGGGSSGGFATDPFSIDADGGSYTSDSRVLLSSAAAVPEPGTLLLVATGGILLLRRRR